MNTELDNDPPTAPLNKAQSHALDIIENFLLYFTSSERQYERMCQAAFDYVDEDHVLREMQEPQKKRVIITIDSGIPEVIEAPDGVDVEIWDYDVEFYPEADLLEDDDGRKYYLREG